MLRAGQPDPSRATVARGRHEAKIGDAVFDQFETDIAAVEEKEFHPALERTQAQQLFDHKTKTPEPSCCSRLSAGNGQQPPLIRN